MRGLPLIALLFACPAAALAQDVAQPIVPMVPASGTVLDVSAQGKVTRTPDLATIRAGVVAQAPSAAAALSSNAQSMAGVLAALRRAGVEPRDIMTADVQLQPQYRYAEGKPPSITGYQATNSVSIRFRDVARAGPILDALVQAGANQIDGPSLSLSNPDAALDAARTDAVTRARARADLYARAAGLRVARIISISEAGGQEVAPPRPMMFARVAAAPAANTEIAPGEQDVTATLSVRFLLQ